jgi:hypothetical protein
MSLRCDLSRGRDRFRHWLTPRSGCECETRWFACIVLQWRQSSNTPVEPDSPTPFALLVLGGHVRFRFFHARPKPGAIALPEYCTATSGQSPTRVFRTTGCNSLHLPLSGSGSYPHVVDQVGIAASGLFGSFAGPCFLCRGQLARSPGSALAVCPLPRSVPRSCRHRSFHIQLPCIAIGNETFAVQFQANALGASHDQCTNMRKIRAGHAEKKWRTVRVETSQFARTTADVRDTKTAVARRYARSRAAQSALRTLWYTTARERAFQNDVQGDTDS